MDYLTFGDVVNVTLVEDAYPFARDPSYDVSTNQPRNGIQGRVIFADPVGLRVESQGGRCMPLFADDSSKIEETDLGGNTGKFYPWNSVISVTKVANATEYEERWAKHERDQTAFYNANGSLPKTSHEFFEWRNSISQAGYDTAYSSPRD